MGEAKRVGKFLSGAALLLLTGLSGRAHAVNETAVDRPAAGAIGRRVLNDQQLWVFACDSSNKLQFRRKTDYQHPATGQWGAWATIDSLTGGHTSCASPPTMAKWASELTDATPGEDVFVYWRDLSNHLIEAWMHVDNSVEVTDMSNFLGIGPIAGAPLVVDEKNSAGSMHRMSVAVRIAGTNDLFTLDHYSNAWHVRPIGPTPEGLPTKGVGSFVASYSATGTDPTGYDQRYLTVQINLGSHMIFTRSSWAASYVLYAFTASVAAAAPLGVLSIGGQDSPVADDGCLPSGCAMYRNPTTNRLMYAPLTSGGNITALFKSWDAGPLLGGSPYTNFTVDLAGGLGFARNSAGKLEVFTPWLAGSTWSYGERGGSDIRSAATSATDASGQAFFAAGANNTLFHWGVGMATPVSLGLNVLPP